MILFLLYLIVINLSTFILFGMDKRKAVNKKWRIPESTLLGLSIIGGSVGSFLGMNLFKHKTKKLYFKFGLPIILILQIILFLVVLKR